MSEGQQDNVRVILGRLKDLVLDAKVIPAVIGLVLAIYAISSKTDIVFQTEGVTVITRGNQPSKALVLLPANQLWFNTGLHIKANQKILLKASGKVHLAVQRLVQSTENHSRSTLS